MTGGGAAGRQYTVWPYVADGGGTGCLASLTHSFPAAACRVLMALSPAIGANTATYAHTMLLTVPLWRVVSMCLR